MRGTYEEVANYIKDGDIVFVRNRGTFVHWLISLFTKAPQVHVGIAFWVDIHTVKHLMVIDANGGQRRKLVSLSHYKDHEMDILRAPYDWEKVVHYALEHLGEKEYSWIEAAYIGISEMAERTINFHLPELDFGSEICSKFVAELVGLDQHRVSPAKLYRMLRMRGIQVRVKVRQEP
jgi:hypothetical protein